jgi:hypothetical protein
MYMQGGWLIHKLAVCVHKWIHCHGAQGVIGPGGIFYDWYDGPVGRHGDRYFANESHVNEELHRLQLNKLIQYSIYGDKGYTRKTHMLCSHHGPGYVTPEQDQDNWIMSRDRVTVEWAFGKVYQRCPLLHNDKMLKLKLINVAMYVRNAVFLTNIHTCLHQNNIGEHFNCDAPSLADYLA